MLKKTIRYPDLDGNEVVEDFYFNLNKAEIAEMELGVDGGLTDYLQKIVTTKDGGEIIGAFKMIIGSAVGRRSEDGKRFVKNQEIKDEFFQTEAYSVLFMDLVTNENAAAEFIKAIVPQDMAKEIEKADASELKAETPAYILEDREPTKAELTAMSADELREAMRRRNTKS